MPWLHTVYVKREKEKLEKSYILRVKIWSWGPCTEMTQKSNNLSIKEIYMIGHFSIVLTLVSDRTSCYLYLTTIFFVL